MKTMPCPHCGSADTEADADAYEGVVAAKCNSCGTCGPYVRFKLTRHCTCCLPDHDPVEVDEAKADAIRAWNRLALATSIAEALEWRDECLAKIARANYPAEQAAPEATTLLFSNEKDVQS